MSYFILKKMPLILLLLLIRTEAIADNAITIEQVTSGNNNNITVNVDGSSNEVDFSYGGAGNTVDIDQAGKIAYVGHSHVWGSGALSCLAKVMNYLIARIQPLIRMIRSMVGTLLGWIFTAIITTSREVKEHNIAVTSIATSPIYTVTTMMFSQDRFLTSVRLSILRSTTMGMMSV